MTQVRATDSPLSHPHGTRLLWPLLLAFCVALPASVGRAPNSGTEETRIAAAIRDGDNTRALQLLIPALRQSPNDAQLWTMQGVAYQRQGNSKEALAAFTHALKLAPDSIPALQAAAQMEFDQGDPKAIPLLQRLLRLRPNDSTTHGMLAVLYYQQGNCAQALAHFEGAAALFRSQVDGLHAQAICLVRVKQFEKARNVLKRTVELKRDEPRELRLLASVELMAHEPEAALGTIQPLLNSDVQDADTLELASAAYEAVHDTEKAVNALRQAILLQPNNSDLYVDFANLSAAHQSFKVGINAVNDGLAIQPQSAALYFARGMLYAQTGEYDKAEADFESAYRLDPSQSLTSAAQGMLAVQQSDLQGALDIIEKKLAQKPNDPILLYVQADVLTQQGAGTGTPKYDLAMQSAKRAVQLNPSLAPAHAVLARLYLQSGDNDNAARECRRSLELNPKDQTALYRLIQALRKTDQKNEIPGLLKRLAELRKEATQEERERYRYRLVESGTPVR